MADGAKRYDEALARSRAYYRAHWEQLKEYHKEYGKVYRRLHRDEINARQRERYATDPAYRAKMAEKRKRYQKENGAKIRARQKERDEMRDMLCKFMGGA